METIEMTVTLVEDGPLARRERRALDPRVARDAFRRAPRPPLRPQQQGYQVGLPVPAPRYAPGQEERALGVVPHHQPRLGGGYDPNRVHRQFLASAQ